ncbi:aspergillopepsin A precursor [Aulographum hederae CBS 113979]|uniref:Aspergillopepsin A n=1 Tax=Aulographum hederae CBS 113979 TaxID=1176131 RepID=A0A6G1GW75_9PEZI|nr:aspergillopepsin A precursor [Aulographum hederae CBS 113979]
MFRAYSKWGFNTAALKRQATNATAGGQTGLVSALPEPNLSEYLEPVMIGGQTLNLDFDTGSSDLWVFSTQLSQQTIGQHSAFDATKSQSFAPIQGATWQISYGDGSGAAGIVGTDVVNIGGATVTKQAVEMATAISQSFVDDTNNDGLVGLAFSTLNTVKPQQQKTFFDNIMPQLQMPVFTVDLTNDTSGTYEFGRIDQSKFQGQLTTVPVNAQSGFWQIDSPNFSVGGVKMANTGGSPAIADTGTSLLLVDDAVAKAYYAKVQGAQNNPQIGGFTYPCNAAMPDFGVNVGPDYMATVPGSQITFAQVDAQTCFGGVQSNGAVGTAGGKSLQIYGDTMFKTQFVVFDGANKQLQIAPKN